MLALIPRFHVEITTGFSVLFFFLKTEFNCFPKVGNIPVDAAADATNALSMNFLLVVIADVKFVIKKY